MTILTPTKDRGPALSAFFAATFAASEGADEGRLIGELVRDLLADTPDADIRLFTTEISGLTIAAGIFTRLTYLEDRRCVFLLSPMAVSPEHQRQGFGQGLLRNALTTLKSEGVDSVLTYGDPNYYTRIGFRPVSEDQARAPLPLSLPHGWLGQSLLGESFRPLHGPSYCVEALARPAIW
jgi:putative acetyltransferase